MFIGEYECSIDAKGRLMLPAKFRETLNGEPFYITKGTEGQITLYPKNRWEELIEKLNLAQNRKVKRFVIGSAQECEFDNQGRFTIQTSLKSFGEFNKKDMVIGMGDQVEIWAQEKYDITSESEISEIAKSLDIYL